VRKVAIIQARMGSTRLAGKVLRDLGGQTVLARVVRRTRRATLLDETLVATSLLPADDAIAEECHRLAVACFRGDEDDVLDRYYHAAGSARADVVVRITADCPLIEPQLIDELLKTFAEQEADYATNALVISYPRGLDVEVFSAEALRRTWFEAKQPYERVHVTPYLYEQSGRFQVLSVSSEADYSSYRWTLDTADDLEMIRSVYEHFGNRDDFHWRDVLALMEREPALAEMNSHVQQKALREG
jgi:spore coat polysaccharide biosynthesis protein SpsF